MRCVIAAAGTGGHVVPALSVADALVARGVSRADILFLGGDRLEAEAVPRAGYPFVGFELTRLRRSISVENLKIPVVLRRTAAAMSAQIREFEARAVLGMAGYVTVPAAMAARRAGVPFLLQEQNASPGLAARFASRRARATFVGLPGRSLDLPRAELTGNPLRPEVANLDRRALRGAARQRYGIVGAEPVVGVLGGSLGARVLNQITPEVARAAAAGSILHLTGHGAHAEISATTGRAGIPWVTIPYEPQIEYFYAACDLVVCRAGAMTVSELAATGTPSILVPLARVGQQWNAAALAEAGGAVVVAEGDVGSVPALVDQLLTDERRLAAMSRAAASEARPAAAMVIADRLVEAGSG